MSDDAFKKQREGYMVKKVEVPKKMRSQGHKFWSEITNHQFCFDRRKKNNEIFLLFIMYFNLSIAQLEVDLIKNLERSDLIRFYDHYISPHSIHRRKLSIHVKPSASALQNPVNATNEAEDEEEGEPGGVDGQMTDPVEVIVNTTEKEIKLTEQPNIIDTLVHPEANKPVEVLPKKELNLPTVKFSKTLFFSLIYLFFSRRNGLKIYMFGKAIYHAILLRKFMRKLMYLFFVNYKEQFSKNYIFFLF